MDILTIKMSISMMRLLYLFVTFLTAAINIMIAGDTSFDPASILCINHTNFDTEFNNILKSKLYIAYTNHRAQQVRNNIVALTTNLEREKIDLHAFNRKYSAITLCCLFFINGLSYCYAQWYGLDRNIFCSKNDTDCFNAGFMVKNSAYDQYLYAIVAPWIFCNMLTLGFCLVIYKKQAYRALNYNVSIDQKKWAAQSFLSSLHSGTFIPDVI